MQKEVYIFGAGGHTRSLIALLTQCNFTVLGIYDSTFNKDENELINTVAVIGDLEDYKPNKKAVLSIGDNLKRSALYAKFYSVLYMPNVVHPRAFIEKNVVIGNSNFVFSNVVINANAVIGSNNIINTGAIIEHEVEIGSHNHISVGAIICGRSKIGNNCFLGAGSVVNDKVEICDNVTIGSNSTVTKSIGVPGVYVGQPIRKID